MTCTAAGQVISVTDAFATSSVSSPAQVGFEFGDITNPTTLLTTDAWVFNIKSGDYLVDKNESLTSTFTCSDPCLTCATTPSTCLTCDLNSGTPYFYGDTCNTTCPTEEVDLGDKNCVTCSNICKSCTDTVDKCTACHAALAPYLYNDTCNDNC